MHLAQQPHKVCLQVPQLERPVCMHSLAEIICSDNVICLPMSQRLSMSYLFSHCSSWEGS